MRGQEAPVRAWGEFLPEGPVRPLAIVWEGDVLPVEQVYTVGSARSVFAGRGAEGLKYRCRIAGRESVLRLCQGIWYLRLEQ